MGLARIFGKARGGEAFQVLVPIFVVESLQFDISNGSAVWQAVGKSRNLQPMQDFQRVYIQQLSKLNHVV